MIDEKMTPQIRFKGYTNAWEQGVFSDIASVKRGLTYSPSDVVKKGIRVLRSSNIDVDRFVTFEEDVFVDKNVISIEYAENGDILITSACGSQNLIGKHAKIDNITPNSAVCGGFMLLAKSDYPDFLNASMSSKWYLGFLSTNISGGNGAIGNLNVKELENQSIYFPKKDERSKIGDLFRRLDDLISLHQRKCEKLKLLKQGLLEKIFPADKKDVPEIRFKGYTNAWEQGVFSDIASVKRGLTYSPSDVVKKGIRVLRSSNIDVDRFVTFEEDVFVDKNVISIEYAENGDILITSACGSQNLIGKHAKIDNITPNSAVCGGFMLLAKSDYPDFLNASMSSKWYLGFLSTNISGGNGAIGNLNVKELENQSIYFPKKDERSKIGDLFRRLDDLISLHQRKVEKLKKIKKAMLERMFI